MRRGFTLIELIFVIVIIGVLSAVAVPKFTKLKGSAVGSSALKVANDAYASIPSAFVNAADLNGESDINMSDVATITGKGWDTTTDVKKAIYKDGTDNAIVVTLGATADRNASIKITCANFSDTDAQTYCNNHGGDRDESIKF